MEFHIVDVFADAKYKGNQLAVFRNAGALSKEQMQEITKEIGFQESTFIISEDEESNTYKVRIFTPEIEMQFAGHPTVGTSWIILNKIRKNPTNIIYLHLPVGKIKVEKIEDYLWFTSAKPTFMAHFATNSITLFSNLTEKDFVANMPVQMVSTGSHFIIVPLNNEKTLQSIEINLENLKTWVKSNGIDQRFVAFYFYCFIGENISARMIKARMLFIEENVLKEDSATGSAASCLLAYLLEYENSSIETTIFQGEKLNRPSEIKIKGNKIDNNYNINVGGKTQYIAHGNWEI